MTTRKNYFVFLMAMLMFSACAGVSSAATLQVGNGGYSTIAAAVAAAIPGDSIHINDGTYSLTNTVDITKNNLTIYGDGYDQVTVTTSSKSYFATSDDAAFFEVAGVSGVNIYGIKFQGPASSVSDIMDNTQTYYGGHDDYHNAIKLTTGSNNCKVHDCYFTLLLGDGIRTATTNEYDNEFYNNIFNTTGHDGIQSWGDTGLDVYNNYFSVVCNCGIRLSGSDSNSVHDNTFTNGLTNSGWCSVELQGDADDNTFDDNVFTATTDNYPYAGYSHTGTGTYLSDSIYYSTPATKIYNVNSYTESNNTAYTTEHDWASWGFGFNEDLLLINGGGSGDTGYNGSILPTLIAPANGSYVTLDTTNSTTFSWSDVGSTNYNLQISKYPDFSALTRDRTTTNTSYYVNINNNETYYWRVRAYVDSTSSWTDFTESNTFYTFEEPVTPDPEPAGYTAEFSVENGYFVIRIGGLNTTQLTSLADIF